MFSPSRDEVREMFFRAWCGYRDGVPVSGIEALALDVILQHPEYHSIEEQLSIDQPPGIRVRWQALLARWGERHDALHQALECLAEMLWRSQRDRLPPDAAAYLSCLERRARP